MNGNLLYGFKDRHHAGLELAELLLHLADEEDLLILGLPRGGVPVAAVISEALGKPFDVLIVRKLGVPGHEEFAMGALASGGVRVLNDGLVAQLGLSPAQVEEVVEREADELFRRDRLYRGERPIPAVAGRPVVIVDDGIATGSTVSAAIQLLRQRGAAKITVAAPVAPPETVQRLKLEADQVVVALEPEQFGGVGRWYQDFAETTDDKVQELLAER